MDSGKRKREGDDDVAKKMKNTKDEEEEVEEFFAILRRIHVALKYLGKADGSGRSLTATTWKPSFEVEDFGGQYGVVNGHTDEDAALDLNSEPGIEFQRRDAV